MTGIKNGDAQFFDNVLKTAESQVIQKGRPMMCENSIPEIPKDPRCDDFGQFRIRGTFSSIQEFVQTLVNNGYSVTIRNDKDPEGKPLVFILFSFRE